MNSIYRFASEKYFILRLQIYIDVIKKTAFLAFNDISAAEFAF